MTFSFSLSDPGLPEATVEWYKGSKLLTTGGRFTVNENTNSLTITDLVAADRGVYQARAINMADSVTADYQLFVNCKLVFDNTL